MNKLVVLSLSALLTGCFKIGPDYIRPQVETPKQWRFAESNVLQNTTHLKWWEQLDDPVLNRLVNQAVQGNLDLKIAIANVEQFMGQYGSTRANLFPQIFGAGNYAHDQPSSAGGDVLNSGTNSDEVDFARLGASMNWELDIWGRLRRANEAARADLLSQEAIKRAVILTLVSQVAQTYIALRELDKNLEITQSIVKSLEEERRIAKIRVDEGYTSWNRLTPNTNDEAPLYLYMSNKLR